MAFSNFWIPEECMKIKAWQFENFVILVNSGQGRNSDQWKSLFWCLEHFLKVWEDCSNHVEDKFWRLKNHCFWEITIEDRAWNRTTHGCWPFTIDNCDYNQYFKFFDKVKSIWKISLSSFKNTKKSISMIGHMKTPGPLKPPLRPVEGRFSCQ